jgi:hypothetical protein
MVQQELMDYCLLIAIAKSKKPSEVAALKEAVIEVEKMAREVYEGEMVLADMERERQVAVLH